MGAVTHRQKKEFQVHDLVEVDSVLYTRVYWKEHPGGKYEDDVSYASTSSRPMLVAAASHAALSKIGFRLFMESQVV